MFSFQNPAGFLLLLLIPLFYLLRHFKILKQNVIYAVLSDWEGKHFEWHGKVHLFFSLFAKFMMLVGFVLSVLAFCDPIKSTQEKVYTNLGTDIIFVVDTSPSMAAKDIDGNRRIDAAKTAITKLAGNHDGCRFGIVILGSNSCVTVPPTGDSATFEKKLAQIQVGTLGNGSAIGDGLSTAVCHLASSSAQKKCIILLTDGENNAGEIHPETAAKLASENKITLYVVGIGSRGTVPIEYTDLATGKLYSGYLESDFNSASLKKIAQIGNGRYFEVVSIDELSSSLASVAKAEVVNQNFTYRTITTLFFKQFLTFALILFAATWILKIFILHESIPFRYKRILILRTVFLILSYIMLVFAWSGISWGTYLAPVQKNNTAVSFVFDISNSMLTRDCPGNTSRLKAAGIYAKRLLEKMNGNSVSVVISKGDAIAAIPLTEDYAMIETLLEVISPSFSTVPGTSIGKGIMCAKETFPQNYSAAGRIWVFTDGEETDSALVPAITECIKFGIPLTIVGFGSEIESEIVTGDGKTKVLTALRSENVENSIETAKAKLGFYKNQTPVDYIISTESGSAGKLLSQLTAENQNQTIISYEAKTIPRYKFFLILGFLLLAASFFAAEFDFKNINKNDDSDKTKSSGKNSLFASFIIFSAFSMFSCSSESSKILQGTFQWHQKNYQQAVSLYRDSVENAPSDKPQILDFALYDLGVAYSLLGEDEAAMERYSAISSSAPENVKFNAYYNAGIIAHKNGQFEQAQDFFRRALEIDSSRLDAKINMELSIQMVEAESRQSTSEAIPASEESQQNEELENTVFQHIKENDKKQWKNSEQTMPQNLANDY